MYHDLHLHTAHLAVHEGVGDMTPVEARTASQWPQDALKETSYTHLSSSSLCPQLSNTFNVQ